MIPNDLAKTSTPAMERVLPYSIVPNEDICLPNPLSGGNLNYTGGNRNKRSDSYS